MPLQFMVHREFQHHKIFLVPEVSTLVGLINQEIFGYLEGLEEISMVSQMHTMICGNTNLINKIFRFDIRDDEKWNLTIFYITFV